MFAVIVTFNVKKGAMDRFLPLMLSNAATSLGGEQGCHQFDVCTDPNRPNEVFLYELYTDAAAFDAHLKTSHFGAFDAAAAGMIESKDVKTCQEVHQ